MEQMKRKAKDAHQVLYWKEKVQRDLEKRVMEDKARAKVENAVAVKRKTTDVKKDLQAKSDLIRMEKLLQEAKKSKEAQKKEERL